MNRRSILLGLLAGGAGAAAGAPSMAHVQATPWDELLAAGAARIDAGDAVGLQVAVRRGGAEVFSQAFGAANLETRTAMTPDSVLRVGSVTKQFTAAVALLLQQEGRLSLDDTLARHVPEAPQGAEVTLRRMLNHTAGLRNITEYPSREALMQAARTDRSSDELLTEILAQQPFLSFEPGTGWAYSNTGYLLMGLIIERIEGRSLAEVFRERLFRPLALERTAIDAAAEIVPGRASGYSKDPWSGWTNATYVSMTFPAAAGALRSSARELALWAEHLHAGRVMSADSLAQMLTPGRLADGGQPVDRQGRAVNYGLGLRLEDRPGVGRIASHDGDIMGFTALVRHAIDQGTSMAVTVNADRFRAFATLTDPVDAMRVSG